MTNIFSLAGEESSELETSCGNRADFRCCRHGEIDFINTGQVMSLPLDSIITSFLDRARD